MVAVVDDRGRRRVVAILMGIGGVGVVDDGFCGGIGFRRAEAVRRSERGFLLMVFMCFFGTTKENLGGYTIYAFICADFTVMILDELTVRYCRLRCSGWWFGWQELRQSFLPN